jgi:hypothetical protein
MCGLRTFRTCRRLNKYNYLDSRKAPLDLAAGQEVIIKL